MITLIADIETDNLLDKLTCIWCLGIADADNAELPIVYADQPGYPSIEEGLARLAEADRVVFHNGIAFDVPALEKLFGRPMLKQEQVYDTLVAARLLEPETRSHSLKDWGKRLKCHKGDFSDFSKFSEDMVAYLIQDVVVLRNLYKHLTKQLADWGESVELEHQVAWIIDLQTRHGFAFDEAHAQKIEAKFRQEIHDQEKKLQETFQPIWVNKGKQVPKVGKTHVEKKGVKYPTASPYVKGAPFTKVEYQVFNPGSDAQIVARLKRLGWKPTVYTKSGQPSVKAEVLLQINKIPEAKVIADYKRVQKKLGMLSDGKKAWLKSLHNGRLHGRVNSNGAVTGRMTHFDPNVAQADKKDLDMRRCFVPSRDRLVGVDASGLEVRIMAHYMWRWDHGAFAKVCLEGKKEDETDDHSLARKALGMYKRDNAKRFRYAMIYGAQNPKLGSILVQDALEAGHPKPPGTVPNLGKAGRARLEAQFKGLGELAEAVMKKAKAQGWIKGLDGRRIYIRSLHSRLNTLFQGGGAIIMKKALVIFDEYMRGMGCPASIDGDWCYVANVHDEVQIDCIDGLKDIIMQTFKDAIKEAGVHFGVRCPLDGDAVSGLNWAETH